MILITLTSRLKRGKYNVQRVGKTETDVMIGTLGYFVLKIKIKTNIHTAINIKDTEHIILIVQNDKMLTVYDEIKGIILL